MKNWTTKEKLVVILFLAIPAMIENILQTIVGFVDTLFIAKLGLVEVTAVRVANAVLAIYLAIFMEVGVATSSLIARSIGAEDMEKAKTVAKQSVIIALFVGAFFGLFTLFFAEFLMGLFGAEAK